MVDADPLEHGSVWGMPVKEGDEVKTQVDALVTEIERVTTPPALDNVWGETVIPVNAGGGPLAPADDIIGEPKAPTRASTALTHSTRDGKLRQPRICRLQSICPIPSLFKKCLTSANYGPQDLAHLTR